MAIVVLSHRDVEELLPLRACIDLMADALVALARGEVHQPLRSVVRPPGAEHFLGLMPAYRGGESAAYGLKEVCVVPENPRRGLDAHQGAVLLHSGETGELLAVANASAVTALRTAAVSALATRVLARDDARRLAVVGAGVQARAHLRAMAALERFDRARIASRRAESARRLADELAPSLPFALEPVETVEEALRDADVVVTATSATEPVVRRAWLSPGVHINAVGSCVPFARELDAATMAAGALVVDRRESALAEAGDYILAAREGAVGPQNIRAELGEILVGERPGRTVRDEITIFESLGLAVEDLAAVQFLYRRALETGAGGRVDF